MQGNLEQPTTDAPAYRLRPAAAADLAAVEALLAASDLAPNEVGAQFGPQFVVATDASGAVIGVAGVERYGRWGLLRSAAVRAEWRGRGVGEALTADRIAWAREQGLAALFLLTQTAAGYWPRFGFEVMDRAAAPDEVRAASEWASGCPASATAMRLALHAPSPESGAIPPVART